LRRYVLTAEQQAVVVTALQERLLTLKPLCDLRRAGFLPSCDYDKEREHASTLRRILAEGGQECDEDGDSIQHGSYRSDTE